MGMLEAEDRTDLLVAAFERHTGALPTVLGRAPGRVNLMGEHTDYNAGLVLPVALPHGTRAAARSRDDGRVRLLSLQQDDAFVGDLADCGPGGPTGWAGYAAGVLWALSREGLPVPGVDLVVDSTVPLGAGLSSSAALECAVGAAVLGLLERPVLGATADLLVRAGIAAEREVVGAPTGGMDQAVSVHGTADHALLIDFEDERRRSVPLQLTERGLALLVTDTRVSHALVDGGYGSRRDDCEEAARRLGVPSLRKATLEQVEGLDDDRLRRRARHVVTEIDRVTATVAALETDDREALARLTADSHASMREDFEISCPELDAAVAAAVGAGALGARMTGGGFGGSAVAWVPTERVDRVVTAIDDRFAGAGFRSPQHLLATPSAGAAWTSVDG